MRRSRHSMLILLTGAMIAVACAGPDQKSADSLSATAAPPSLAGTWTLSAVPETGDTTPIPSTLVATADTTGWVLRLANRPPTPVRVTIAGDSVVTVSGPYESVIRPGVQVTTTSVYRVRGDSLVGRTTARYTTTGADSVLHLRVTGRRAP